MPNNQNPASHTQLPASLWEMDRGDSGAAAAEEIG
jgi:hypothetical protein